MPAVCDCDEASLMTPNSWSFPSCEKCWMQVSPVPASDEVCPPVCASYEMCSCVSSTNLKCIIAFLLRERKDVLLEIAKELRVEIDITLPKIEFKKRICQSKYYDEESVKCLLEGILEERDQEFEKRCQKIVPQKRIVTPPVRCTNVSHPSEVGGKEFNVNRSSDCEVKMKVGLCEGRVRTVAMGAQRVINPDNIGKSSFELKRDKGVANPEGLICENICEEKYTIGTLMGCEKQITVNWESFRNHTIAKIAGQLQGGKENTCKADVRKYLEDGLAMRLPLSEPREIYKDSLETDNGSNIGSEFSFEIDLPGKRDRSTVYRLNLIK
ncbi:uncharacterized protein TNCV_3594601 [Trichonephila clavipes]|nr:uncharacterized protein TNCV_3594601 [Trichonephila clavipes]